MTAHERLSRKLALTATVLATFYAGSLSLRNFYLNGLPPHRSGECVNFRYPGDKTEYFAQVISTDDPTRMCKVVVRYRAGSQYVEYDDTVTYGQMRALDAKKVGSNEDHSSCPNRSAVL